MSERCYFLNWVLQVDADNVLSATKFGALPLTHRLP